MATRAVNMERKVINKRWSVGNTTYHQTNDVAGINRKVKQQAQSGDVAVNSDHGRVFGARTSRGRFQIRVGSGEWLNVESVIVIE